LTRRFLTVFSGKFQLFFCLSFSIIPHLFAVVYLSAQLYFQETNQRLNAPVAQYIVKEISPFVDGQGE
jgi:hypothetical protein